jgi:hypothetical protein
LLVGFTSANLSVDWAMLSHAVHIANPIVGWIKFALVRRLPIAAVFKNGVAVDLVQELDERHYGVLDRRPLSRHESEDSDTRASFVQAA